MYQTLIQLNNSLNIVTFTRANFERETLRSCIVQQLLQLRMRTSYLHSREKRHEAAWYVAAAPTTHVQIPFVGGEHKTYRGAGNAA